MERDSKSDTRTRRPLRRASDWRSKKLFYLSFLLAIFALFPAGVEARTAYAITADDQSLDQSDGLSKDASWQTPEVGAVIESFSQWFKTRRQSGSRFDELRDFLQVAFKSLGAATTDSAGSAERLDVIIDGIALLRTDIRSFRDQLRQPHMASSTAKPEFDFDSVTENEFVANHASLFYGRWLAQHQFYDEALERLEKISLPSVLDPATLLFYRGLMQHQLLKKDECLETVALLLENRETIPRRYAVLGQLMLADIEPLKTDSLDEVARMMSDVGRRTGLNRSGKRVRDQEKEVIEKLDKLIKKLEDQQKKQQQMQQASNRSSQAPSQPIDANKVGGGGATGDVKQKRQEDGGQWGDLPPAQRAAALAEMSKDMPPHYRAVIEEYFRRLADAEEK